MSSVGKQIVLILQKAEVERRGKRSEALGQLEIQSPHLGPSSSASENCPLSFRAAAVTPTSPLTSEPPSPPIPPTLPLPKCFSSCKLCHFSAQNPLTLSFCLRETSQPLLLSEHGPSYLGSHLLSESPLPLPSGTSPTEQHVSGPAPAAPCLRGRRGLAPSCWPCRALWLQGALCLFAVPPLLPDFELRTGAEFPPMDLMQLPGNNEIK